MKITEISKIVAIKWNNMHEEDKKAYFKKTEDDSIRYKRELK